MWWVVNATPRPLYRRERPGTHRIGCWVDPTAGLDGCGKSRPPPTGIRSPDHPVRSESLYRLRYSGPFLDRFSKNSHITFDENPSSVRRVVSWGRREGQTDRHDEANSSFFAILRTRLKNLVSYLTVNTVAITKLL